MVRKIGILACGSIVILGAATVVFSLATLAWSLFSLDNILFNYLEINGAFNVILILLGGVLMALGVFGWYKSSEYH